MGGCNALANVSGIKLGRKLLYPLVSLLGTGVELIQFGMERKYQIRRCFKGAGGESFHDLPESSGSPLPISSRAERIPQAEQK